MKYEHNFIYQLLTVFWKYFLASVFFYMGNALAIFLVLFVKLTWLTIPAYAIALLLVFPAIGALADLLQDSSWRIEFFAGIKKYFRFWRQNAKSYFKFGLMYSLIFLFLLVDLYSVNNIMKSSLFTPVILILTMLALISLGWIVAIQAYFKIDFKNSLKLMAFALPRYALQSVEIIALFFLIAMGLYFIPQLMVFVVAPVIVKGLIMIAEKPLRKVELRLHLNRE